jgi:hypothetical protein
MLALVQRGCKTGGEDCRMTAITDWVLRMKGARNNSRFAREVRIAESSVRDLVRPDTLKIFSSETLGRLLEYDKDPEHASDQIVLAYLRSLARLPKRQYTVKRSKMTVAQEDLVADDLELESE